MMKNRHWCFRLKLIAALILMLPICSIATVKEVTLFPHAAKVWETAKIIPQCDKGKCGSVIILPPQADPESLVVSLAPSSALKIEDVQVKPAGVQDEAKIAELRKQINALQEERKEKLAKSQALETQLQFWQTQTKEKTKTVADAYKVAEAIGGSVRKITLEKFALETQLEKIDKNLKKLQDELNQAAGRKESAWEVMLTTSGPGRDESISYSYSIVGCGWQPLYRLEAVPANQSVSFSWDAEVWQSSGTDWKQVKLSLATLQPVVNVNPPEMPDWIIRPRVLYKTRGDAAKAENLMKESVAEDEALAAAPVETRNTTYSVWSLGSKDIPAGQRQRLKIKDESWPAEFLFVARPALSQQAFVRAKIKLDKPAEIPAGQTIYVIDGAILGKREFSFAGSEGTLFFGSSPLISVTASTLSDQSGEKTIFQDKQTRNWQWLIEAKNSSNTDIKLRIEEPVPQARDKRIKLNFKQSPEPAEKDHAGFVWLLDVPAGEKKTIRNNVELEAPSDMNLDFGWR